MCIQVGRHRSIDSEPSWCPSWYLYLVCRDGHAWPSLWGSHLGQQHGHVLVIWLAVCRTSSLEYHDLRMRTLDDIASLVSCQHPLSKRNPLLHQAYIICQRSLRRALLGDSVNIGGLGVPCAFGTTDLQVEPAYDLASKRSALPAPSCTVRTLPVSLQQSHPLLLKH